MNSKQRRFERRHDPAWFSFNDLVRKVQKGLSFYQIYGGKARDCDFYMWPMVLKKARGEM